MAIKTVGNLNDVLKNYDASSWSKKGKLELTESLGSDFKLDIEGSSKNEKSFSDILANSILEVNKHQVNANEAIQRLVLGKDKNIHETLLLVEKAEIAFKTMNQVRMKVIDAYKEVMRMQV